MRIVCQILAIVMIIAPAAQAQKWPTTEFEVLNVTYSGFLTKPETSTEPLPDSAELRKLEGFLSFSAKRLEEWGFPAPHLQVNSTARCARCYHIYMSSLPMNLLPSFNARGYAITTGASAAHGTYIVLNIDRGYATSPDLKSLRPEAYITALHELVHPVLKSTPYAYDKPGSPDGLNLIGNWIEEGIPDAIAYSLYMEYFAQANPRPIDNWTKFYGARAYDIPLAVWSSHLVREVDATYAASSFWRYLAELNHKKKAGPDGSLPGPAPEPADYSYLVELLNAEHRGIGQEAEYEWLESGLKATKHIRQPLSQILPRFFATVAGYAEHRAQSRFTQASQVNQQNWLYALFGACHRINLATWQMSDAHPVKIPALAATCLYVDVLDASSDVAVDIQVRSEAKDGARLMEQLWLGTPGGQSLGKATASATITSNGREVHLAVWKNRLIIKPGMPAVFILSNVGTPLNETAEFSGTLRVSMNRASSGVQGTKGAVLDTTPGPDGREEAAIERARAYGTSLSGTGSLGVAMTVTEREMSIELGPAPEILSILGDAGGSGGLLDQVLVSGAAIEANQAVFYRAMEEAIEFKRTVPGAEVEITLPPLPFGFQGTLSNVKIRSSGGPDPDRFTVGPKDALPGSGMRFDPSGTVTIEEYSPWILAGSYRGDLVDPNPTEAQRRQSQPVLEVVGKVEGTFSISAPWVGDERIPRNRLVDPWADLEADIQNRLPPNMSAMASELVKEAREAQEANRAPDFSSARTMGAPSSASCDCSCSGLASLERMGAAADAAGRLPTEAERAMAACAMTCAPQYAACEADW